MLFGDSHAAHWFPPLREIAIEKAWRLIVVTKSGCPSIDIEPFAAELGRSYWECTAWRRDAIAKIREIRPQAIMISNSQGYFRTDGISMTDWGKALESTLKALEQNGTNMYVMRDTPRLSFDAITCLSRASWRGENNDSCSYQLADAVSAEMDMHELSVIGRFDGAHRLDLIKNICSSNVCPVDNGEFVLFNDSNHLTVDFANSLKAHLMQQLIRPEQK